MKIKMVIHYAKWDTECDGDYYCVELFLPGRGGEDELLNYYGDHYHDKGLIRASEFINGAEWALGREIKVEKVRIPDGKT